MNDENFENSGRASELAPAYSEARIGNKKPTFGIDIDAAGKNARALQGIFILDGKPIMTTYELRDFLRKLSKDRKRITVEVVD